MQTLASTKHDSSVHQTYIKCHAQSEKFSTKSLDYYYYYYYTTITSLIEVGHEANNTLNLTFNNESHKRLQTGAPLFSNI